MAKKKTPEINSSSTADIAFLLLCFFLMTTTMNKDDGIARRLPPMPPENQVQKDQDINKRNVVTVRISSSNKVLAGSSYDFSEQYKKNHSAAQLAADRAEIVDYIKQCLTNTNDPNLPEMEAKEIEGKTYMVTRGVISMQNDRGTSYGVYMEVQNLLVKAVNELREEFCQKEFGKSYKKLTEREMKIVKQAVPQRISEAEPKDVSKGKKK